MRRRSFLTSSIRVCADAGAMTFATAPLLALARVSDDLVAGLAIGFALGFLAGPLVRHLLAVREWAAAAREARLTDELLARLPLPPAPDQVDAGGVGPESDIDDLRATGLDGDPLPVSWRTSR